MTDEIPAIDLEAALAEDAPADLLLRVREAAERIGLIQVVNHGVPLELIEDFERRVERVLRLPRPEKAKLASPTGHPFRGWRQWPDDLGRLELERYSVGQFDNPADAAAAGVSERWLGLYKHGNVWPPEDPDLRGVTFAYAKAAVVLAQRVLGLYERLLGLPAGSFPDAEPHHINMIVNDYPTWTYPDTVAEEEKLLLLEHTDGSAVTILHQHGEYSGLQAQQADGTWIPVPVVPGALQVFSGTILTRWTNGLFRPVRHRVVAGGSATRQSTGIFYHPSLDTVLEPLPAFVGEDGTEFEPVVLGEIDETNVENYLKVFGRPEQVAAWREGRPFVSELAETSAGR
ncbi:dioxygenase, isopenicillin N synthase [Frankia casuarinae]|uniref:2OG-Fe(II) oxygenase n=1 Tax=Frankia casuarinae (strain DSM 45818 / CECT 9043 / HFP020203 / CcI3) TaxID=106370 RepID=Q2JGL3_FRACC|nr:MULTISPECIES: 2OG-Fe(II) oxygenase family protein [Frankia]ABD09579.1 2OG-Fe(II) oxygenase [Frankia casuarinae]ETA03722.1 dioxygenase, isopenicillin N synthase [Frankia sp. CcI6]EYT93609.1 dioxygenase, isopenicillin N synthase [Frankia casuarinae]KDA43829.1 dioxygenase, isopenicillin N synthase [Frankia sp. BMG5.23]KEZ37298.1 dioxygenase, isopenicillin N synthase [Frankia sp. CeD]